MLRNTLCSFQHEILRIMSETEGAIYDLDPLLKNALKKVFNIIEEMDTQFSGRDSNCV